MRTLLLILILPAIAMATEKAPRELLAALTPPPEASKSDRELTSPSERVLSFAENEIVHSEAVRQAVDDLNPARSHDTSSAAVAMLEHEHAVWCLQVCLYHPRAVSYAVDALTRLKDVKAVPSLLALAEHEHKHLDIIGSRNVTMQDMWMDRITTALSTLTGVPKLESSGNVEFLDADIPLWRQWVAEHPVD